MKVPLKQIESPPRDGYTPICQSCIHYGNCHYEDDRLMNCYAYVPRTEG
jgi:hypothetical protein